MSFSILFERSLWCKQKTELCKLLDTDKFWCLGYALK